MLRRREMQMPYKMTGSETLRAIFADLHFWIPAIVLILGITLLIFLR